MSECSKIVCHPNWWRLFSPCMVLPLNPYRADSALTPTNTIACFVLGSIWQSGSLVTTLWDGAWHHVAVVVAPPTFVIAMYVVSVWPVFRTE